MSDPYHLDLTQFSLAHFRQILETREVLPGRKVLKEQLPERFAQLEQLGLTNLHELLAALKTPPRLAQIAAATGLPVDYLTILRREANSYLPKPFNLAEIPEVDPTAVERLAGLGLKNTQQLFARVHTPAGRLELAQAADLPLAAVVELAGLADLARISGVGPVFARLFYAAGVRSLADLEASQPEPLFARLHAINAAKQYTKIMATLKDVVYCIDFARILPKVLEL